MAAELTHRLDRWAKPVTQGGAVQLVVQLDPPDEGNAWQLTVSATGIDRHPVPLDRALVTAPSDKRRLAETELARLERLLPALLRPGGHRRGEVILSQDEAWELMSGLGRRLAAAGFDVRVPRLSTKRATPTLRLEADSSTPSVVGANQLANVRWSVLFDDVELDAAEIARLAAEARPLVQVARPLGGGRPRRPGRGGRGAGRAGVDHPAHRGPSCCATPSASRARRWPAA